MVTKECQQVRKGCVVVRNRPVLLVGMPAAARDRSDLRNVLRTVGETNDDPLGLGRLDPNCPRPRRQRELLHARVPRSPRLCGCHARGICGEQKPTRPHLCDGAQGEMESQYKGIAHSFWSGLLLENSIVVRNRAHHGGTELRRGG